MLSNLDEENGQKNGHKKPQQKSTPFKTSDNPNYRTLSGFTGASVIDMQNAGRWKSSHDAGALCESGVSRTGRDCPVQREAKGRIGMIYRPRNLTGCVVVLQ